MKTTSPEPTARSGRSNLTGVVGSKSPTTLITTAILTGVLNNAFSLRVAPEELVSQRVKRSGARRRHRASSGLFFVGGNSLSDLPQAHALDGVIVSLLEDQARPVSGRLDVVFEVGVVDLVPDA